MTYDLRPTIKVQEHAAAAVGITEIVASLKEQITKKKTHRPFVSRHTWE